MKPNHFGVISGGGMPSPAAVSPAAPIKHLLWVRPDWVPERWSNFGAAIVLGLLLAALYLRIAVKLVTDRL